MLLAMPVYAAEEVYEDTESYGTSFDTSSIMDHFEWEDLQFNSFTPVTVYDASDQYLKIYPCYSVDKHILVRKVELSGQQFWTTILNAHRGTCPFDVKDNYSYFTDTDGTTYAFITIDNTTGYFVETVGLPSGYLIAILKAMRIKSL